MSTLENVSGYFRKTHNLPENWEAYAWECIPPSEYTHIKITGCLTDVFKRGPRKGQTKYTRELEKTYILSNAELETIGEENKAQELQGALELGI